MNLTWGWFAPALERSTGARNPIERHGDSGYGGYSTDFPGLGPAGGAVRGRLAVP